MLPEDLARLLALHHAAKPTGTGLNPRLLALLEARAAAEAAAPRADAELPGPAHMAGDPPRPTAAQRDAAVASGAVAVFPAPAARRRRAAG